jgi:hypothetical protein
VEYQKFDHLPALVHVDELVSSRYDDLCLEHRLTHGCRPVGWDERRGGIDVVRTREAKLLKLESDGGQSPPKPGWVLILRGGDSERGYGWTLYGFRPPAVSKP